MPVTFQGGYVGGPTPQQVDLSPITSAVQARNARLDAPQAQRLTEFDVPGLAYLATQGDQNAQRFLDRYYGKGQWQQYVPEFDPERNTFVPPAGVPWNWESRDRFERYVLGTQLTPAEGASAPSGKESGAQKAAGATAPETNEVTPPPTVATAAAAPTVEVSPQVQPVPTDTAETPAPAAQAGSQWQRPWKQQEINETTPPVQEQQAIATAYVGGAGQRPQVTESATQSAVMQALQGGPQAAVQRGVNNATALQRKVSSSAAAAYEQYLTYQRAGQTDAARQAYDAFLTALRGGESGASMTNGDGSPMTADQFGQWYETNYLPAKQRMQQDLVARMQQQRQAAMMQQQAAQRQNAAPQQQQQQRGSSPYTFDQLMQTPLMGNPATPIPAQPQAPQSPAPIDPRTGKPIGQIPGTQVGPNIASVASPRADVPMPVVEQPSQTNPLLQVIEETRDAARSRAAGIAADTEANVAAEQVQIISEATGRGGETVPTLYLGKRSEGIALHSAAERSMGEHLKQLAADPSSRRGKAAAAAVRNVFKQGAPALRQTIRESVQQNGMLVPAGEFARQVADAVRADPQGSAMYFNELATNFLNAGTAQADIEYKQALARETAARTRGQEQQNVVADQLGVEFLTDIQKENLRSLRIANDMAELQLGFAPQQFAANIMESLTAIGVNRVNAQAVADSIGLGWAQLELEGRIREAEADGTLRSQLSEENYKRVDLILKALEDPGTPEEAKIAYRNEMAAALGGVTFTAEQRQFLPSIFGLWKNVIVTPVPGFQSYTQPQLTPQQQAEVDATRRRAAEADAAATGAGSWASEYDVAPPVE